MRLCRCGCKGTIIGNNLYLNGHNRRGCHYVSTPTRKENLSLSLRGKSNPKSGDARRGKPNPNLSLALLGRVPWNKGKKFSSEYRQNLSLSHIGKLSPMKNKKQPKTSATIKKMWQDPIFREKTLRAAFKSFDIHPNKPEAILDGLLQKLYPNEWKFVGDGSILIGFKSPDFININGQKKIIEMYGDFWHRSEKETNGAVRIAHFKKYGYDTLIIWQHELEDRNKIIERLKKFAQQGDARCVVLSSGPETSLL